MGLYHMMQQAQVQSWGFIRSSRKGSSSDFQVLSLQFEFVEIKDLPLQKVEWSSPKLLVPRELFVLITHMLGCELLCFNNFIELLQIQSYRIEQNCNTEIHLLSWLPTLTFHLALELRDELYDETRTALAEEGNNKGRQSGHSSRLTDVRGCSQHRVGKRLIETLLQMHLQPNILTLLIES